jgi:hypothetical protein
MALSASDIQRAGVTVAPTPGQGLTLDINGLLSPSLIGFRAQRVAATASTDILGIYPGTPTDITGATLTISDPGIYLVIGHFDFNCSVAGVGVLVGNLLIDGVTQNAQALFAPDSTERASVGQTWLPTITTKGTVLKLGASKTINAGTANAYDLHTTITAIRVG